MNNNNNKQSNNNMPLLQSPGCVSSQVSTKPTSSPDSLNQFDTYELDGKSDITKSYTVPVMTTGCVGLPLS